MKYYLFLDDVRMPEDAFKYTAQPVYNIFDWDVVRNYDEFINVVKEKGVPDGVSFDHDLADFHYQQQENIDYDKGREKTGFHCAKWLIDFCLDNEKPIPDFIMIHSMNTIGSLNIKSLFETYNKVHGKVSDNHKIVNCNIY